MLLALVEHGGIRAAAQQRSGLDVAIADEQVLKLSGVGVEGNVVDLAELVAPFAQGSLADELEVSLGSGPFPIVPGGRSTSSLTIMTASGPNPLS